MKKSSRKFIPVLFSIYLLLLLPVSSSAFFPPRVDSSRDPELSGKLGQIIGPHWFERKTTIFTGEDGLGKAKLDEIYQAQLDSGIRNIPLLSLLLVRESLRALERDDPEKAAFLCGYAKRFAPDFPSAYFTMGRIHWSRNKTLITLALREYVWGTYAIFRNFRVQFFKSLNALYLISGAGLVTFVAFALFMALKYLVIHIHEVKKDFDLTPLKLALFFVRVFAFVVPVLLQLNLLWSLLYWTILLWGYLAKRERQMIVVFLFFLVYVPWILQGANDFLRATDPTILMSLHQANETNWGNGTKKTLKTWGQENPEDPDILFTLGLLNKREGNYKGAERYYKSALQLNPNWPECISNLGNVYLSTRNWEAAITQYEQAISLSPGKASFHFNLHRASATDSILASERVGQALDTAQNLDPGLVAFYTEIYSANTNRSVVDDTLGASRLWKRTFQFLGERYSLPEGILEAWVRAIPGRYDSIYPVFFLVFLLLFWVVCSRKTFPKRCPLCGTPSMKFFPRRIEGDKVCFGCNRLFVKKESIDPKMREKKMRQVRKFERRRGIVRGIFTVIIPGGGHIWREQSIKGAFFLFLFFLFAFKFLYWQGIIQDPSLLREPSTSWSRLALGFIFVLYYFAVLRSAVRIES